MLGVFSAGAEASKLVSSQCVGQFSEQELFEGYAVMKASSQLILSEFKAVVTTKSSAALNLAPPSAPLN
jgi:hypothetical protein